MTERAARNPWAFVPLMYFLQAIPVALVQEVGTIVYKDLGVANESITRWTSIVALPWSLQMLLGPLVDLSGTRRQWVVRAQLAIAAALVAAPLLLRLPNAFELSLGAFFVAALFSALCNAAMDGFYLLALPKEEQAKFAGIQSTCYRLGTLFAKGLLVLLAGKLVALKILPNPKDAWTVTLLVGATVYGGLYLLERRTVPRPEEDIPAVEALGELQKNIARTLSVVGLGISGYFVASSFVKLGANAIWKVRDGLPDGPLKGWRLPDEAHALGQTLPFNGVGAELVQLAICVPLALTFLFVAQRSIKKTPMGDAFGSFFRQPGIAAVLAFLMFYRFGEAMVMKMSPLFLKDTPAAGGLGLGTDVVGTIKGLVGVFGIVLGGIAGGLIVSRAGLKKSIWPLAICMHLPNLLYLWASHALPRVEVMYGVDFFEQFGYGFGFAGYTIVLQRIAQRGNYRTAHYALGVGVGALFIQVAGVLSGVLQANFGYQGFFLAAVFLAIPGLATLLFLPVEE
jgi:PAT family beta-lactamase induction signal transducer AmpG